MPQLKNDEWPAEDEPTTTEAQCESGCHADHAHGHVPTIAKEPSGEHELTNVGPDESVD